MALLVRPSRRDLDAAAATFGLVTAFALRAWLNALAAADFDAFPVDGSRIVLDAAFAAAELVALREEAVFGGAAFFTVFVLEFLTGILRCSLSEICFLILPTRIYARSEPL